MAAVRINWKLILVLLIAVAILTLTAIGLRKWFRTRTVEEGYSLGQKAHQAQQWDQAAEKLGDYLAVNGDDIEILMLYADAQLKRRPVKRGNVEQAISAYRRAIGMDENNEKAVKELVDLYLKIGIFYEAQLKAEEFLKNNDDADIRLKLANALMAQRKFKPASKQLSLLIEKYPNYAAAYEAIANYAARRPHDFPKDSIYWLNLAIEKNPKSALAYTARGSWFIREGQTQQAIDDLQKALSLAEEAELKLRLAREFIQAGKFDIADKILDEAEKQNPADIALWQIRGFEAIAKNDKVEIAATAKKGLEKLGYNSWDFLPLATELLIDGNDLKYAEKCILQMEQMENKQHQILFFRGLIAYNKNDTVNAISQWKDAIEFGYKTPRIRTMLASAYTDTGNITAAIQQLRTLVNDMPYNFGGRLNLARLLSQSGDAIGAAEQAQLSLQLKPDNEQAMLLYARSKMKALANTTLSKDSPEWLEIEKRLENFQVKNQQNPQITFRLLQLALQGANTEKAEQLLKILQEKFPDDIETQLAGIEMQRYQSQTANITADLKKLIKKYPDHIEPVKYLIMALNEQQQRDECVAVLQESVKNATIPRSKIQLALLLADMARTTKGEDAAFDTLKQIAAKYPNSLDLKRKLLTFEKLYSDTAAAQQVVDQIKKIEGKQGWQWKYEQAKLLYLSTDFQSNYNHIINILREALASEPASQEVRLLLGAAYSKKGDTSSAISIYRHALTRAPNNPNIIAPLVAAFYKANEYNKAEALLKQAAMRKLHNPMLEKLQVQSYLRTGDYQAASEILKQLLEQNPDDTDARLSLALFAMREGNFEQARESIDILKDKMKDSSVVDTAEIELAVRQENTELALGLCQKLIDKYNNADSYITRGRTCLMLAMPEQAEKDFQKAVSIDSKNADIWLVLCDFYRSQNDSGKMLATIDEAIKLFPDNIRVLKQAIMTYGAFDDYDSKKKSGDMIDNALKIDSDDPELNMFKAHYLISQGTTISYDKAIRILVKLTENYPGLIDGWILLTKINLDINNIDKARTFVEQGLIYAPDNRSLLLLKAKSLSHNQPTRALDILTLLNQKYPQDTEVLINYADALTRLGQTDKAVALLTEHLPVISDRPNEVKAVNLALASALQKAGKTEESEKIFSTMTDNDNFDAVILSTKAKLFIEQKKWYDLTNLITKWARKNPDQMNICLVMAKQLIISKDAGTSETAEEILRKLLEIDSDNVEIMGTLGIVLQTNGNPAESVQMYEKIIELQPDNIVAINNLSWMLCEEQGNYERAMELAQKALEKAPNYEDLLDTRGVIYYRTGQYDKAVKDFQRAIKLIPTGNRLAAGALFHLGRTYADMDERAMAIEYLSKAIELDQNGKVLSAADIAQARRLLYKLKK